MVASFDMSQASGIATGRSPRDAGDADTPGENLLQPFVSVVVPAYNVGEFIVGCIRSLESQSYGAFEIVAVDDGSTDETPLLLRSLQEEPGSRLRVLHQKNGGLSVARNAGLLAARGSHVVFVDGDDVVAPDFVALLTAALVASGADVSACGHLRFDPSTPPEWEPASGRVRVLVGEHALAETLYFRGTGTMAWGKLASADRWRQHQFPAGMVYEDLAVVPGLIASSRMVALVEDPLYGFAVRPGSITRERSIGPERVLDLLRSIEMADASVPTPRTRLLSRAFAARRAAELSRAANMRYLVREPEAVARELKQCRRELRRIAPGVLLDSQARISTRVRVLLAVLAPALYGSVWKLRKRAEGWF